MQLNVRKLLPRPQHTQQPRHKRDDEAKIRSPKLQQVVVLGLVVVLGDPQQPVA